MIELTLQATTREQELIKHFLEENASEELANKINNGVKTTIDGKEVINRKTLDGFMKYATDEASKTAENNANSACIEDKVVFGWAMHYFEEDSIVGTLYNLDGTEYKKVVKTKPTSTQQISKPISVANPKKEPAQYSLFEIIEATKTKVNPVLTEDLQESKSETVEPESVVSNENEEMEEDELNDMIDEASNGYIQDGNGNAVNTSEFDGDNTEPIVEEQPKGNALYQKYMEHQAKYPTAIIAFILGDFFEVFGDNAVILSTELNLTLTSRDCGLSSRVPVVGFPYHGADEYFSKIVENHDLVIADMVKTTFFEKEQSKENVIITEDDTAMRIIEELFGDEVRRLI